MSVEISRAGSNGSVLFLCLKQHQQIIGNMIKGVMKKVKIPANPLPVNPPTNAHG